MVATWKPKEVEELAEKMSKSKVVGLVSVEGIPSKQLQSMRKSMKGKAEIKVSKKNLITRAFDKAKLKGMSDHLDGSLGLVFSDLDPFKLNRIIESGRTSAPPKAGSTAPKDIVVPSGDTPLPPGPVIGELQQAGIKAKIAGGKIAITEDSLVVKEGEDISPEVASALTRLGIEPIEIGLELKAAYENGIIYTLDVLHIDEEETISRIQTAYSNSFNLAMNSGIYNDTTVPLLIAESHQNALNLALNSEILNSETIKALLSKASAHASALNSLVPEAEKKAEESTPEGENPTEEKKEEESSEETKEEGEGKTEKEENPNPEEEKAGKKEKKPKEQAEEGKESKTPE